MILDPVPMPTVIVASKNPVKIRSVEEGLRRMFPGAEHSIEGVSVPSGVADQPMDDAETFAGARNRAMAALAARPDAELCFGVEGGCAEVDGEMSAFAWVVACGRDGRMGKARTGTFFLPAQIAELLRGGMELGAADDIVFGMSNSKQQNGAVGILTKDATTRTSYYTEAVVLALIPFQNEALYPVVARAEAAATA